MVFGGRAYSVLVVSGSDKGSDYIRALLPADRYYPVNCVKSASEAKRTLLSSAYDIVIINTPLPDEFGTDFAVDVCDNNGSCPLLLVKSEMYEETAATAGENGVFTISKPTSKQAVASALDLLCAARERVRRLEEKNRQLAEKLDEIRIINHAKWVLIEKLNMNEQEAHRYIEKQSMDMRITKREAAEDIIRIYRY